MLHLRKKKNAVKVFVYLTVKGHICPLLVCARARVCVSWCQGCVCPLTVSTKEHSLIVEQHAQLSSLLCPPSAGLTLHHRSLCTAGPRELRDSHRLQRLLLTLEVSGGAAGKRFSVGISASLSPLPPPLLLFRPNSFVYVKLSLRDN